MLVGVLESERPEVILTIRSRRLARHAGQVAFPGGAADQDDPSHLAMCAIGEPPAKVVFDRADDAARGPVQHGPASKKAHVVPWRELRPIDDELVTFARGSA